MQQKENFIMIPVSVCIITKNEAEHLDKCLKSLSPYPFEIVVVDTGSTDNSKEIARKYTDKVFDFEWVNDFSAARNFSISRASHNMIFVLDTDELLVEFDFDKVQQLIAEHPKSVGLIKRLDYFDVDSERHCQNTIIDRLFNRKYYHYERPIHEILVPIANISTTSYDLPIVVDHFGYVGTAEKLYEKSMRDINLLLPEIEKIPMNHIITSKWPKVIYVCGSTNVLLNISNSRWRIIPRRKKTIRVFWYVTMATCC